MVNMLNAKEKNQVTLLSESLGYLQEAYEKSTGVVVNPKTNKPLTQEEAQKIYPGILPWETEKEYEKRVGKPSQKPVEPSEPSTPGPSTPEDSGKPTDAPATPQKDKNEEPTEETQVEEDGSPDGEGQIESDTQGEQEGDISGMEATDEQDTVNENNLVVLDHPKLDLKAIDEELTIKVNDKSISVRELMKDFNLQIEALVNAINVVSIKECK
jgi:hypothetical protein